MSDALRRYLEQQAELGGREVFLGRLTPSDAIAAVRSRREGSTTPPMPPAPRTASTGSARLPAHGPPSVTSIESRSSSSGEEGADRGSLDYEGLRADALGCTRCALAGSRTQVVFSDGNPDARLVVVGEAPGANEDATGLPFVGAAGQLLDLLLAAVDLSREHSVYICNVLKCRPPGNRNPLPEEIDSCSPFLRRQLALVRPQAVLAVGTFAAQLLTGEPRPIGKLRGTVHSYEGTPLVVTYHPAALLRNQSWTRATWDDLQLLRQVMDGAEA